MIINRINWTMVAVFSLVVLLVFLVGVSLLGGRGYGGCGTGHDGRLGLWLVWLDRHDLYVADPGWFYRSDSGRSRLAGTGNWRRSS